MLFLLNLIQIVKYIIFLCVDIKHDINKNSLKTSQNYK